jgi:hypothetical protein
MAASRHGSTRMLGNGERVFAVGLRTVDAEVAGEVAEDMGHGPEG